MNITKKIIIKKIVDDAEIKPNDASRFVSNFFELSSSYLKKGNLKIHKFGSFSKKMSPKRIGRNPRTLEEFDIKARNRIVFKASKKIQSTLN